MKIKINEHQLQTQIMNYLKYKGWYVMRLNSGKFSVGEGRAKRFVHGQEAGTPDILAFRSQGMYTVVSLSKDPKIITTEKPHADLIFIEVKVPGNKPTKLQELKMKELEEYGARCIVAHSLEEVEEQL